MIKLSIIIPYYNRPITIKKLIDVLRPQLTEETEVIIVDDHSKEPLSSNDEKIKIIRLEENSGGASVPRNIGLDNAKGEYIAFIDSDDMIKSNYIEKVLEKTKEEWDYCYISWETKKTKIIIRDNPPKWNCCVWNCIYKRELIGNVRFDPKLKIAEDYNFNAKVRKGKKANITEILYYYEQFSPDSLVNSGITYNDKYKEK